MLRLSLLYSIFIITHFLALFGLFQGLSLLPDAKAIVWRGFPDKQLALK